MLIEVQDYWDQYNQKLICKYDFVFVFIYLYFSVNNVAPVFLFVNVGIGSPK